MPRPSSPVAQILSRRDPELAASLASAAPWLRVEAPNTSDAAAWRAAMAACEPPALCVADLEDWLALGPVQGGGLNLILLAEPDAEAAPRPPFGGELIRRGPDLPGRLEAFLRGAFSPLAAASWRLQALIGALPDIVYELDVEGRFVFVNEAVKALGYEPEDLLGRHFSVLLHEDSIATVDRLQVLDLFRGARTGRGLSPRLFNERRSRERKTENLELRLRRGDAATAAQGPARSASAWGEVSSAGIYAGSVFQGSVGIVRDITMRLKSEETLRKLYLAVEQVLASVLVADRSFVVEYANPAFFALSGHEPQDVVGASLFDLLGLDASRAEQARRLILDGFDLREESSVPRCSGAPVSATLALSPVRTPEGEISHAVAIVEDSSERRAMEDQLRAAKEDALRASQVKNDFLAAIGHELRSPLAGIVNAAGLAKLEPTEAARLADSIDVTARQLLESVRGVLEYARSEAAGLSPSLAPFPLADLLDRVCAAPRVEAARRGIGFAVKAPEPETIVSDADLLSRALAPIVEYEVKFALSGTVVVEARVERSQGNPAWLVIVVSDSEKAFESHGERTYEPLALAETGFSRGAPGAGLALALSRNVVRALGGEIGYSSGPAQGAVFRILIPAGESRPAAFAAPAALPGETFRPLTVLLVDDNEVNLEYLRAVFEGRGHRTIAVSNGPEALRALEERLIDGAILDIQMPGMSGVELAGRVRSSGARAADPDMPIIALTAYDPGEIERSGVRFDAVYAKPADANRLVASLASIVAGRELFSPAFFDTLHARDREGRVEALEAAKRIASRAFEALREALADEARGAAGSGQARDVHIEAERLSTALIRIGAPNQALAVHRFVARFPREDREILVVRLKRISEFWDSAIAALEGSAS